MNDNAFTMGDGPTVHCCESNKVTILCRVNSCVPDERKKTAMLSAFQRHFRIIVCSALCSVFIMSFPDGFR